MKRKCVEAVICTALAAASGLQAQAAVITGRVFDSLRMTPMSGVHVRLTGTALLTRTAPDGTYRLVTELQGRQSVGFAEPRLDRFLGSVTTEVDLAPGREVRADLAIPRRAIAPSELCSGQPSRFRPEFLDTSVLAGETATVIATLRPAPVRLAEFEIRVEGPLERAGFADRQRIGLGKFWNEREIRRFDGDTLSAVLGLKANLRENKGVLMNYSRSRACPIPGLVDGALWAGGTTGPVVTLLRPEQVAADYAGPAQVPMEFQSLELRAQGFSCGLLVVWTRGRA